MQDMTRHSHTSLLDEFEHLAHHIEAALEYAGGSHTLLDVLDAIKENRAQFFPLRNSAIVTEIVDYPQRSVCRIWLAGGDMDELLEAEKIIARWAKKLGCTGMEIIGRKGWERQMKDYKPASVVLVKDISDE